MASARDNRALFRSLTRQTCPTVGCKMWRPRDFQFCARCLRRHAAVSDLAHAGAFGRADGLAFRTTCAAIFKPFVGVLSVVQAKRAISIERGCIRDDQGKFQWAPNQRRYLLVDLNPGSRPRLGAFFDKVDHIFTWFRDGNLFLDHDYFVVDPTVDAEMRFLFYSMEELPAPEDYNPSTAWWSDKFRQFLHSPWRGHLRKWEPFSDPTLRADIDRHVAESKKRVRGPNEETE